MRPLVLAVFGIGILTACAPRPEKRVYQAGGHIWSIDLREYEDDPDVIDLYRGYLEAEDGRFREAMERYDRVATTSTANPDIKAYALYLKALALIDPINPRKNDREAAACLTQLLAQYPYARVCAEAENLLDALDRGSPGP